MTPWRGWKKPASGRSAKGCTRRNEGRHPVRTARRGRADHAEPARCAHYVGELAVRLTFVEFIDEIEKSFSAKLDAPFSRTLRGASGATISPYSKWGEFAY